MSIWNTYLPDYRRREVEFLTELVCAGDCASVVGLSGAGKSNLLGFLHHRASDRLSSALVDCNRLVEPTRSSFFSLLRQALGETHPVPDEYVALEGALSVRLGNPQAKLCLILDRFDALAPDLLAALAGSLRALRDAFKYQVSFITASRRPLDARSELAELFYASTLWLGPLVKSDALWSISQYAARRGQDWDECINERIMDLSWGYPSFLRAICEAYAAGCPLEQVSLLAHPALQHRLNEFWSDNPTPQELSLCGLKDHPLLLQQSRLSLEQPVAPPEESHELTAKEALLLAYLQAHPGEVCDKDDLIRAVWEEDKVFMKGIRDDSLAQLVRRLRRKIEPDPANPHAQRHIHSVIGRGYRYTP